MPRPRDPFDADYSLDQRRLSLWAQVVIFGVFCFGLGISLAAIPHRLDTGEPIRWNEFLGVVVAGGWAIGTGIQIRRRIRSASVTVGLPTENVAPIGAKR